MSSVDLVNRLAPVAEEMNHHPDLEISWNKVTVELSTHSEGGLTENDFELAGRIDGVAGVGPCYPRPLADERRRAPSK